MQAEVLSTCLWEADAMNHRIPWQAENFFTCWGTVTDRFCSEDLASGNARIIQSAGVTLSLSAPLHNDEFSGRTTPLPTPCDRPRLLSVVLTL
jgi:hypothetical protein